MGAWGWKWKRGFRQLLPIALAGLIGWGAYQMFFTGAGLRGTKTAVNRILRQIPFFGSRFRSKPSYRYGYARRGDRHGHVRRSYRHGRSQRSYREYPSPRRGKHYARPGKRRARRR